MTNNSTLDGSVPFGTRMAPPESQHLHGSLPERTYERLRSLIVRGRIPSGARVVEADVAQRFGISRTPVREALSRLVQERYLVPSAHGKRTELVVAPFSGADIRELWEIIGSLESSAAAMTTSLPAERRRVVADDLQKLNVELRSAASARPRDPDVLFQLQTAFHLRFVHETAGPHLRFIYDGLRPHVQRYEWIYGTMADADYEPSAEEHLRIIEAIGRGDVDAAREAVLKHWTNAAGRTVETMNALDSSLKEPPKGS
jgi:DNA-binding GntR family transcriptional regulator